MKTITINGVKYAQVCAKDTVSKANIQTSGLSYWTRQGFKVTVKGLKYNASNGKTYDAVKGVTKDGKELLLKSTRNGQVFVAKDF